MTVPIRRADYAQSAILKDLTAVNRHNPAAERVAATRCMQEKPECFPKPTKQRENGVNCQL
jgi:hypothetical protein